MGLTSSATFLQTKPWPLKSNRTFENLWVKKKKTSNCFNRYSINFSQKFKETTKSSPLYWNNWLETAWRLTWRILYRIQYYFVNNSFHVLGDIILSLNIITGNFVFWMSQNKWKIIFMSAFMNLLILYFL